MGTPVSGPGKFSERTDKAVENANLRVPDAGYGEQKALTEQRQGAPVGGPDFASLFGDPGARVVDFAEPSTQPNTPITNGAALGPGASDASLGLPDQKSQDLEGLIPYMPVLEFMANQPGASWAMRNLVRNAKALQ